jgi:hypothetical protein
MSQSRFFELQYRIRCTDSDSQQPCGHHAAMPQCSNTSCSLSGRHAARRTAGVGPGGGLGGGAGRGGCGTGVRAWGLRCGAPGRTGPGGRRRRLHREGWRAGGGGGGQSLPATHGVWLAWSLAGPGCAGPCWPAVRASLADAQCVAPARSAQARRIMIAACVGEDSESPSRTRKQSRHGVLRSLAPKIQSGPGHQRAGRPPQVPGRVDPRRLGYRLGSLEP